MRSHRVGHDLVNIPPALFPYHTNSTMCVYYVLFYLRASLVALVVKNLLANAGDIADAG